MIISLLRLKKEHIKMSNATCETCGKVQESYLMMPDNNYTVCIQCWLDNAVKTSKEPLNETPSNDYRTKYFSGDSSFNAYFNY